MARWTDDEWFAARCDIEAAHAALEGAGYTITEWVNFRPVFDSPPPDEEWESIQETCLGLETASELTSSADAESETTSPDPAPKKKRTVVRRKKV